MQHYVFIRHMVRHHERELDTDWLEYREELFRLSTLKSLRAQTDQNFKVLLVIDEGVPEYLQQRVKSCGLGEVCLQNTSGGANPFPWRHMAALLQGWTDDPDEMIITTGIDNDDMMHVDYIKTVNEMSRDIDDSLMPTLITPTWNHKLSLACGLSTERKPYSPPVMSLVERANSMHTCWINGHGFLDKHAEQCLKLPLPFLMLIHVANMSSVHQGKNEWPTTLPDYGLDSDDICALRAFLARNLPAEFVAREKGVREKIQAEIRGRLRP